MKCCKELELISHNEKGYYHTFSRLEPIQPSDKCAIGHEYRIYIDYCPFCGTKLV
jgi:hypothetical protein